MKMPRSVVLAGMAAALVPPPARAQALTPMLVGNTGSDADVPILYGIQSGLFRRAGLDVTAQRVTAGAVAVSAVLGGAMQIAGVNLISASAAYLKGIPLQAIVPGGLYDGTTEFSAAIVKKDAPFRTGRDLNGRTAGVASVGDLNAVTLFSWIDKHGGDSKTVKQVEVPYSVAAAALEEGRIDVCTTLQPFLSQAVASGKARIFADVYGAIAPRFVFTAWAATATWTAANPEATRSFARAVRESMIYCNAHHTETATLLSQATGVDVGQILRGGRDTFAARYLDAKDYQPLIDAAATYGAIGRRFDGAELISPAVRGLA